MRKILFSFLALLNVVQTWGYTCKVNGLCYNIHSDYTATLTYSDWPNNNDYTGHYHSSDALKGDIVIPSAITYNEEEYTVTAIDENTFYDASSSINISSVTIPSTVTSIGNYAFMKCTKLSSVVSESKEPFTLNSNAFYGIPNDCVLSVPYGTRDAYIAAGWTTEVFKGGIVEIAPETMNITIGEVGIATYCSPFDLDFSSVSGLKAYIISGFSPTQGKLTLTPVDEVPAGEGLLLKGAEGSYEVPCTTTDMYYSNLLKGVTTVTEISPTEGDMTNFILADGAHGINFYTLSEAGSIAAGKAYLQLPTSAVAKMAGARGFKLVFDDETTGINGIDGSKEAGGTCYDLQGRRIAHPAKGLYIVNGKKVFIK